MLFQPRKNRCKRGSLICFHSGLAALHRWSHEADRIEAVSLGSHLNWFWTCYQVLGIAGSRCKSSQGLTLWRNFCSCCWNPARLSFQFISAPYHECSPRSRFRLLLNCCCHHHKLNKQRSCFYMSLLNSPTSTCSYLQTDVQSLYPSLWTSWHASKNLQFRYFMTHLPNRSSFWDLNVNIVNSCHHNSFWSYLWYHSPRAHHVFEFLLCCLLLYSIVRMFPTKLRCLSR